MVLSAEKRKALITKLNGMVDVPFLNEQQEQKIVESLLNVLIKPLETALPSDAEMTNLAKSAGEETMRKSVKQQAVEKMNQKLDIPGIGEAQEAMVFGMVVDFILKDKFDEIHRTLTGATTTSTTGDAAAAAVATTTTNADAAGAVTSTRAAAVGPDNSTAAAATGGDNDESMV